MTQTEAAEAKKKKKLNIKIVADRDTLRLFRADNTELEESREIGSYDLEKGEVLVLRQPQGGG
jgi:hypothetical protein